MPVNIPRKECTGQRCDPNHSAPPGILQQEQTLKIWSKAKTTEPNRLLRGRPTTPARRPKRQSRRQIDQCNFHLWGKASWQVVYLLPMGLGWYSNQCQGCWQLNLSLPCFYLETFVFLPFCWQNVLMLNWLLNVHRKLFSGQGSIAQEKGVSTHVYTFLSTDVPPRSTAHDLISVIVVNREPSQSSACHF